MIESSRDCSWEFQANLHHCFCDCHRFDSAKVASCSLLYTVDKLSRFVLYPDSLEHSDLIWPVKWMRNIDVDIE